MWPSNSQYPEFGRNVCVKASAWHTVPSDRERSLVICISYNKRKLANKKVNWQDSFTFLAHFKKNYLFILAALSLHCCLWIFPRFSNQELFSNCDEQASHWAKFRLQCRKPTFDLWVWNIPWRGAWQPTPVFLSGESHGLSLWCLLSCWGSWSLGLRGSIILSCGLSSWGMWALEYMILVAPKHVGSSWTQGLNLISWNGRWNLIHSTTRAVPWPTFRWCLIAISRTYHSGYSTGYIRPMGLIEKTFGRDGQGR